MPQVKTSRPLTYYIDTPSIRVFQEFAGESLDKLDQFEAWDIITALCQAVASATANDEITIDIPEAIEALDLAITDKTQECLDALDGFPASQVNALMLGILAVAFEVD